MADSQRGQLGAGSVRGMHQPATTQFVRQPRRNVAEEAQNVAGNVERVGNETAEDLVQKDAGGTRTRSVARAHDERLS